MKYVFLLFLMGINMAYAENWLGKKIWKTAGKSVYSDTPPNLRLENVQIFYPRTGKLSPIINERASKKNPPPPPVIEEDPNPLSDEEIELLVAQAVLEKEKNNASETEQARRSHCQAAQEQLQAAMHAQNPQQIQQYEEQVVQHCIAA